jgi:hypothetical protein
MKATGLISTAIASLLLGIAVPMYAQHEQKDDKKGHPEQQQAKHEQAKTNPQHAQQQRQPSQHAQQQQQRAPEPPRAQQQRQQPRHAQQQRQDPNRQQHAQQQRQVRDDQKQRGNQQARNTPEQHRIQQSAWQQHRSQRWESDHRSWQRRGGYNGYRIPDDRFRRYFGPDHGFRIYGLPFMVYRGYPRFRYGGYWITAVDPWPEYWGNNWYDNDDVYVTYVDDGYYMYNRRYPTVGIAIRISM